MALLAWLGEEPMKDKRKTKDQLIEELTALRQQVAEYEAEKSLRESDHRQAEQTLRESEEEYRSLFENMDNGFALHEMMFDEAGRPIDYIFLAVNETFEKQTTLKREEVIGKRVTEILPGIENDPADWIGTYGKVVLTGKGIFFEHYAEATQRWSSVTAYRPKEGQFAVVLADITEQVRQRQRRQVITNLRETVWRMKSSEEMGQVLRGMWDGLQELGVVFDNCGVNIVDKSADLIQVRVHSMTRERQWSTEGTEDGAREIGRIWRDGKVAYRSDLAVEDAVEEQQYIEKIFAQPIRSVIDVPFSHGTLAVNSTKPNAFSPEDIEVLQEIAQVLSEGFTRLDDIKKLEQRNQELEEKDRLLTAFHRIGQTILSSLDLEQILDALMAQLVRTRIFRSLSISLVDEENHNIKVVRSLFKKDRDTGSNRDPVRDPETEFCKGPVDIVYDLESPDILAEVVRNGEVEVIDGWDEDRYNSELTEPETRAGKMAYFIPVKQGERVLAVLATGSQAEDREEMLRRIEAMQPLLDQIAIALEHVRLYTGIQKEMAERQRQEEALRESELKYRTLFDMAGDGIFLLRDDRYIDCNQRGLEMFGASRAEVIGSTPYHRFSPPLQPDGRDSRDAALELIDAVLSGEQQLFEWRHCKLDGTLFDVEINLRRVEIGGEIYFFALWRDITERKRAEEALRASEVRFRTLLETNPVAMNVSRADEGTILYANPKAGELLGVPVEELIGRRTSDFYFDLPERQKIFDALSRDEQVIDRELRLKKADGSVVWTSFSAQFTNFEGASALLAVVQDITERKRAEEALRESEARLDAIFRTVPDTVYMLNLEGKFTFINDAIKRYGYTPEELIGTSAFDLIHPDDRGFVVPDDAVETQFRIQTWPIELRILTKEGKAVPVEVNSEGLIPLGEKEQVSILGVMRDITDRKLLEEQREQAMQADHLQALGEMAAGVAHELNQPLNGIRLFTEGTLFGLKSGMDLPQEELIDTCEDIVAQVDRMTTIIEHMRTFARDTTEEEAALFQVREVVEDALKLIGAQLKVHGIDVRVGLADDLPTCRGWPFQMEQVLLNLLTNARDALDERRARIQAGEEEGVDSWLPVVEIGTIQKESGWVRLEVSDTGGGIPEKVLPRIFEPFFTTKEVGKGTGLGLALARTTVERQGGRLEIDNRPGEGVTFAVVLPVEVDEIEERRR